MEPLHHSVLTPDGRYLTAYTWGEGSDVVVFEAGLGVSGRCWAPVVDCLCDQVKAVAYDRAGYGTSTTDHEPRTLDRLAADLCCVVEAQAAQSVVLVGHSWGGPIVRRAMELLPAGRVTALVLVDPSDERADAYFTRSAQVMERAQALILPAVARAGALKVGMRKGFGAFLSDDDLTATLNASTTPSAAATCVRENRHIRAGLQQLRKMYPPKSVPVVVISGTKQTRLGKAREQLLKAHRESAAAQPGWRLVEATGSTHYVLLTQPRLVAAEVLRAFGAHNPEID